MIGAVLSSKTGASAKREFLERRKSGYLDEGVRHQLR